MNQRGFCIFINTVFHGPILSVTEVDGDVPNESKVPCVFSTEREAQLEIVDAMSIRLQQFIDGERDFEDAVTMEEYVVEVEVRPDGSIVDVTGNSFG
jgi:hypothetical protein